MKTTDLFKFPVKVDSFVDDTGNQVLEICNADGSRIDNSMAEAEFIQTAINQLLQPEGTSNAN